jgi:hypothetical protein
VGTNGASAGFPYQFSTTTTAADPGTGFFRFNSATTTSITEMYISDLDVNSTDRSGALLTFDDTTGSDKARIYIPGFGTGYTVSITVTGTITNNGTWLTIPVTFDTGALPANNETRNVIGIRNGSGVTDGDKGDITVSASGATWTVDNSAITYAKIQNVSATDRILGRSTAGAGAVEEITCTAAGRALLDDASATEQRTTLGLGTAATKNITTSSSAPTGGVDGDIWIQYTP